LFFEANLKSPLFVREVVKNIFLYYFLSVRKRGRTLCVHKNTFFSFFYSRENYTRTLEHVLFSFLFAGENSMRGIEHVLIFFFAGENSMRV